MRIAHVSDIHIRNFKYREEYRAAFADLYRQLETLRPDLVINTGDTVHSKLSVSPELFDDVANHMLAVSSIAPYWLILGNHDLNLKNVSRTDAISPIVRALQGRTHCELKLLPSGLTAAPGFHPFRFWNYDIRGSVEAVVDSRCVNVGLYHGSVSGCVTDQGFVMEEGEAELAKFAGMDYVLLGDIHKRQSFRDGRVRYPGSLIQQNYGEELVKGFLLWDIRSKDDFAVDFHPVAAPRRFYTIQVPTSLELPDLAIPSGSRIKAMVSGEVSPSQRIELERVIREAYSPVEVITPDSSGELVRMEAPDVDSLVGSRDKLMREHLAERGCADPESVIHLFNGYESMLDQDVLSRGTTWRLRRFEWDDMLNYGAGNHVDLAGLRGLVGIFAPNASGKSSIFDVLMQGLFDRVSKDVPRNVDLVNDNKDSGAMRVSFEAGGREFHLERSVERIHYGQRRLTEIKQWGRTSLDFSSGDESLNGTTRPETERAVRAIIGSFEDFALTTMVTQSPVFGLPGGGDLINCKETDRRKILFRILDLDVYERVAALARDELKQAMGRLKGDRERLLAAMDDANARLDLSERELSAKRVMISETEARLVAVRTEATVYQDVQRRADRLEEARRRRSSCDATTDAAEKRLYKARDRVDSIEAELADLKLRRPKEPDGSAVQVAARLKELRADISARSKSLAKTQGERKVGVKSLRILDEVPCGDSFPDCQFITGAHRFRQGLAEIDRTLAELTADLESRESSQRDLEAQQRAHSELDSWRIMLAEESQQHAIALERLEAATAAHEAAIIAGLEAIAAVKDLEAELDETALKGLRDTAIRLRSLETDLTRLRSESDSILMRVGAARDQTRNAEDAVRQYDETKQSVRELEELVEMCGKNGLPYRILGLVLPLINAEIAKILTGVVRFGVHFEDDPDEQTVSLYIRYGDYKSRPLSLGSGAEKFIASLAVRVALLSVTSLPKTDMLVIDEGFGRLDPEHLESLQRMFEYLRGAFGTVFIISHVDFMRDIVDHSIEITGRDGYAHVEAS